MAMKSQTIEVDAETAALLKSRAAERGVSVSQLVSELVPLAADFSTIAELECRWAAVEGGEQTVPHDEVTRWLKTWGTPGFRPWTQP
jgi:predicted transcriptional regulator